MCTNLLPDLYGENVRQLERLGCERLQPVEEAVSTLPDIRDARQVDARFLEALADELQTYFLDGLTETQQREAIARSLELHRIKGTIGAVEKALSAVAMEGRVEEWFQYGGEPYHFRLDVSLTQHEITPHLVGVLRRYIDVFKNLRSVMDDIQLSYLCPGELNVTTGIIGELSCDTEMIDGYTMEGFADAYTTSGLIGELQTTLRSDHE